MTFNIDDRSWELQDFPAIWLSVPHGANGEPSWTIHWAQTSHPFVSVPWESCRYQLYVHTSFMLRCINIFTAKSHSMSKFLILFVSKLYFICNFYTYTDMIAVRKNAKNLKLEIGFSVTFINSGVIIPKRHLCLGRRAINWWYVIRLPYFNGINMPLRPLLSLYWVTSGNIKALPSILIE